MHGSHHTGHHQEGHGGGQCPSCQSQTQRGSSRGYGYCPQPQMMGGMGIRPYPVSPQVPTTDDEILDAVYQNLTNDPRIPAEANIAVEVQDGVVTITGSAPDKFVKWAAGGDALCIPSVADVNNRLQIGPQEKPRRQRR